MYRVPLPDYKEYLGYVIGSTTAFNSFWSLNAVEQHFTYTALYL